MGKAKVKYDVIVVGGGPAGLISAITARRYHPDKKILLIKSIGRGVIPCGIPYMFTTLESPECNEFGNAPLEKNKVDVRVGEVVEIDRKAHEVLTNDGAAFGYGKLVLATGSNPVVPPVEGIEKKGVYPVRKDLEYLKRLKDVIRKARNIVIIGGGFIGIEFADEFSRLKGAKVTVIEMLPEILSTFDPEFSEMARQKLMEEGVDVITDAKAQRFNGDERVESVRLSDGKTIPADVIILGIGAKPDSRLAEKAGLKTGRYGGIVVDSQMRTYDPDILAAGDCAAKRDFLTGKESNIMLASTATFEARIAGASLFGPRTLVNKGTIPAYSTQIGNLVLASAGLTEKAALKAGLGVVTGRAECSDRHPEKMPGANKLVVKLVFSRRKGNLLGGHVAGGASAGELVNVIALSIGKGVSMKELETLQLATHPKLTAAPTVYPLVTAAQDAIGRCGRRD